MEGTICTHRNMDPAQYHAEWTKPLRKITYGKISSNEMALNTTYTVYLTKSPFFLHIKLFGVARARIYKTFILKWWLSFL